MLSVFWHTGRGGDSLGEGELGCGDGELGCGDGELRGDGEGWGEGELGCGEGELRGEGELSGEGEFRGDGEVSCGDGDTTKNLMRMYPVLCVGRSQIRSGYTKHVDVFVSNTAYACPFGGTDWSSDEQQL